MAAPKHTLVGEEPNRSSKKHKVRHEDEVTGKTHERENSKDKKYKTEKQKRQKKAEDAQKKHSNANDAELVNEATADTKSQRKADKKANKEKRRLEKLRRRQAMRATDGVETKTLDSPDEREEGEAEVDKIRHQNVSSVAVTALNTTSHATYTQTISLSSVPQKEIDEFLSKHEIRITDPRSEMKSLRPIIDFHHLPSTNLLEKTPSPFASFKTPTPIQAASWPSSLSGRDVVGVAETGSGKTMAFALPCVEAVSRATKKGIKAVIVSPTRELAMQTHVQLASIAALARLKTVCLYGGASKEEQRSLLNRGCDIVVATPGRLKDFMSDGTVNLSGCVFAVLDEADRMLDKGFEDDIKQILGACPDIAQRQTLMFTATWPLSVQDLASTFMKNPVKVTIGAGGREVGDGSVELQANSRITQKVEVIDPKDKEFRLLQIIKHHQQGNKKNDRILVFCLYKKEATRIESLLSRKGIRVGGIHGDLRQEQRTRSLEAFKTGQTPVLVATDVAARGLDIPEVKLVINVTVSSWSFGCM